MTVNYSGWNDNIGFFSYEYNVPEHGMVIITDENKAYQQISEFKEMMKDWNNDADVYTLTVAEFESDDSRIEYYTPEELVRLIVEDGYIVEGITRI